MCFLGTCFIDSSKSADVSTRDLSDHQDAAAVRSASSRQRSVDRGADMRGCECRKHEAFTIVSPGWRRSIAEEHLGTYSVTLRRPSQSHGSDRVPAEARRGSALPRHAGTNRGGTRGSRASRGCDALIGVC